jgi:DNA helicase-2/ATP-dependent DNA helicase PcrA
VRLVTTSNDREEAQFVLEKISSLRSKYKLTDFAVLFRTNAQSRPFEEELLRANIPYAVVGGVKFYERAEIKDILSFLRLSIRPHDTPAIERVINVPTRGIGDTTVTALSEQAAAQDVSLWTIIEGELAFLPSRAAKAVREFREIVHDLQHAASNPIPDLVDYVLVRTGYRRMLQESRDLQDESRMENLEELLNSAREYSEQNPQAALADYLDSLTLMSDIDRAETGKGVTLMTLHSAKGLEYKVVFLVGMEEGILPHSNSQEHNDDLEEERRLCYVGMTRARELLFCTHAHERRIHGRFREQSPSPFLKEIPEDAIEQVRLASSQRYSSQEPNWREKPLNRSPYGGGYGGGSSSYNNNRRPAEPPRRPPMQSAAPKPAAPKQDNANGVLSFFQNAPVQFDPNAIQAARQQQPAASGELKRGQKVKHEQFGVGTILTMEGNGPDAKLTVYFDRFGSKKFVARFAKLTRV